MTKTDPVHGNTHVLKKPQLLQSHGAGLRVGVDGSAGAKMNRGSNLHSFDLFRRNTVVSGSEFYLTGTESGRPMVLRLPDSQMNIANFMRSQLYGAIATLKLGVDMLVEKEQVETDRMVGHGGYFKTAGVGQQILADALNVPIFTMETAGEGGPWGMALLAAYMQRKENGE